jgi:hypothetical protein
LRAAAERTQFRRPTFFHLAPVPRRGREDSKWELEKPGTLINKRR